MNIDSAIVARVLDTAAALQQIPAPTFHERPRAREVLRRFRAENLSNVSIDRHGNVFARIPGRGDAPPLVVSAHLDTVFPKDTPLTLVRSDTRYTGPGIGDNAMGLAALFGLVWGLRESGFQLPGDIWLAANIAEEGLGNLKGMLAVTARFGSRPLAYIVLEGMAFGQVYHRALMSERYLIRIETSGGHSWVDFGRPSAVHELARMIHALLALELPLKPRTTLNVGKILGGTSVNTIAASAELELDLRSEGEEALQNLAARIDQIVHAAQRTGVKVSSTLLGKRPGGELDKRHFLVLAAQRALREVGSSPRLNLGSTDANIPLSRGLPAVCIGITNGGGAHSQSEHIEIEPVGKGLLQLLWLVRLAFHPD